jgi:hypothetical protein
MFITEMREGLRNSLLVQWSGHQTYDYSSSNQRQSGDLAYDFGL